MAGCRFRSALDSASLSTAIAWLDTTSSRASCRRRTTRRSWAIRARRITCRSCRSGEELRMIYVEYVSRRQGIALDDFHRVVRQVQESWAAGHGADRLILNAGRTWRLGPEP